MTSWTRQLLTLLALLTLGSAQARTVAEATHAIAGGLIDANVEILLHDAGDPDADDSDRNRGVILYKPTGASHAYAVMVMRPPTKAFSSSWISRRYTGAAQAIEHKDLALVHVGGPISDPHMQLAMRAFVSGTTGRPGHQPAPAAEEAITRYSYLNWTKSSPDQMLTGAFVLSFMSEDRRAIERVGKRLTSEGLVMQWGRFQTAEGEFYFCRTMLREQWGPTQLARRIADLRAAWDHERAVSFLGWTPAETDKALHPSYPKDDVVFSENMPW